MARDEDDDLYDEEFDFVDDEEDEPEDDVEDTSDIEETNGRDVGEVAEQEEDEEADEYGRPKPQADYVVHIYEYQKFKRTIERPFTAEDAEAFASEYNRTSKPYGRFAVAGKNDAKPKKALD
jgi:hypothetical protein